MPTALLSPAFQAALPLVALATAIAFLSLLALALWQQLRSRRLQRKMQAMAVALDSANSRDALTGLFNRSRFEAELEAAVQACDNEDRPLVVLYVGLDGLALVNEGWGHSSGDRVLQQVAGWLSTASETRANCFLARVAGDEFALIVPGGIAQAHQLASSLLQMVQRPITPLAGEPGPLQVSLSIGLAMYPSHGARTRLLSHAHIAMQSVKVGGGNAYADFEPAMAVDHRERALLRRDLQTALERRQFELVYQPKVDARSLRITGAEALLRWNHPQRGMVSPGLFIPVAEKHGLIGAIGNWVIDEACRQAAAWREQGLRMRVAVNLSGYQIRQDDLVERIVAALARNKLEPTRFTCEITESVAMEDTQVTRTTFDRLRAAGLRVSIDDFGTGHSSLASLRRLPAEELKIDRAFVSDLDSSEDASTIVAAIVQMAHTLELRVVAEGVETESQRDKLIALGCDHLQGFLFARPMSAKALALWAADDRPAAIRHHAARRSHLAADQSPARADAQFGAQAGFSDSLFETSNKPVL